MAAAISAAARRHGIYVSESDASLLAGVGDAQTAITNLRAELLVSRAGSHGALPDEVQVAIAAALVIAELRGSHPTAREKADLLGQLIRRHEGYQRVRRNLDAASMAVEEMLTESATQSQKLRRFLRGAAQARILQRTRLQLEIWDSEQRDRALARLDRLYESVLNDAFGASTWTSRSP